MPRRKTFSDKALLEAFVSLVGAAAVSTEEEDLERHSQDALSPFRAFRAPHRLETRPRAIVRPRTTEQVAGVVAFAAREGIPVVPWGGGTGVMGGAISVEGGIVLDLKGMNRILDIDQSGRLATVEAGVVLEDLEHALGQRSLLLGHDPWSLPIATVGGAIATNGVGYRAGKYGPMGQQVLGLEAVLPTGEVIATRGVPKAAGPGLNGLLIGSEGVLGVITRATLEVFPSPEQRALHALSLPSFEAGFQAIMEMHDLGLRPALVDFAEEFPASEGDGNPHSQVELYLGFEGFRDEVEAQERRALSLCRQHGGQELGAAVAQRFWSQRHSIAQRYKREVLEAAPAQRRHRTWRMDYLHVAVPASRVLEYRKHCQEILAGYRIPVREWSLWARPEFFSFMIADPGPSTQTTSQAMSTAVDALLQAAQDAGGSMEYCHGVGLKLSHLMERDLGPGMAVLRRIKAALDPRGILNPGKLGL
ncbi:MAG: FAD-binding oxidoreductase [Chloroflexi bacterium]|nr:FAD-binding oxidoreductase [Chloroflexota bacterium]